MGLPQTCHAGNGELYQIGLKKHNLRMAVGVGRRAEGPGEWETGTQKYERKRDDL